MSLIRAILSWLAFGAVLALTGFARGDSLFGADGECITPERVIETERLAGERVRVLELVGDAAKRFIAAGPGQTRGDAVLVFRDAALPFGFVALFADGCATKYGVVPAGDLARWLEEALLPATGDTDS